MKTFTLIRLVSYVEEQAEATNDVRVYYNKPAVTVIAGGVSIELAQTHLDAIEVEVKYLNSLLEQRRAIARDLKTRTKKLQKFESEIYATRSKNEYLKNMHTISIFEMWRSIENRLKAISGEYLIIPSIYKNL